MIIKFAKSKCKDWLKNDHNLKPFGRKSALMQIHQGAVIVQTPQPVMVMEERVSRCCGIEFPTDPSTKIDPG
jgi:hypothetical protein